MQCLSILLSLLVLMKL